MESNLFSTLLMNAIAFLVPIVWMGIMAKISHPVLKKELR